MLDRLAAYLPRAGAGLGAVGGAAYALQSAGHMIVPDPNDRLIVGVLLAVLGAGIGWLAGVMAALPLRAAHDRTSTERSANGPPGEPPP